MKSLAFVCGFVLFAAAPAFADAPKKALCIVCASNGETELEEVAATRSACDSTSWPTSSGAASRNEASWFPTSAGSDTSA